MLPYMKHDLLVFELFNQVLATLFNFPEAKTFKNKVELKQLPISELLK